MTLAEELMGIVPPVCLLPGRIISFDDPPEVTPGTGRNPGALYLEVKEWLETQHEFTLHDVVFAFGCTPKQAAAYLSRFQKRGLIKCVGRLKSRTQGQARPLRIWKRAGGSVVRDINENYFG